MQGTFFLNTFRHRAMISYNAVPGKIKTGSIATMKKKYQPSGGAGGTRSPPATPHRLQPLTAHLIQNGRRGLERG